MPKYKKREGCVFKIQSPRFHKKQRLSRFSKEKKNSTRKYPKKLVSYHLKPRKFSSSKNPNDRCKD